MTKTAIREALENGLIDSKEVMKILMEHEDLTKKDLLEKITGVDISHVIQEMFMGYKQRKQRKQLYSDDNTIPTTLIKMYYGFEDRISFESLKKAFVSKYIRNESKIEDVHTDSEIEGLREMYEYIHSDEIDVYFNIYSLKELHEKLYSKAPFPEFGGQFRNDMVFLPGTGTDIVDWRMIRYYLNELDPIVLELHDRSKVIKDSGDSDALLKFLDECVILGCQLIKIHPFKDGNGRSVRGFINKLMEDAGLPPIYITINEKTEYHKAMNKANNEGDYSDIKNFYRYKVCDSIIELDINQRVRGLLSMPEEKSVVKSKADDFK